MKRVRIILCAAALLSPLSVAVAQDVTVLITIRNHRFEPARPHAPAGRPIVLNITNADSTPEEFESKTLRVEKVIPGKSSVQIRLRPLSPGTYNFFGEFNEATAQGALIVE